MDKVDGNRSFADSRGHALHITRANIANRKHAWKARFQHLWRTSYFPRRGSCCVIQIPPGEDEPLVIDRHAASQPLSSRRCSRHDEYVPNVVDRSRAARLVLPGDALKMGASVETDYMRFAVHFDRRVLLDPLDQIARHGV